MKHTALVLCTLLLYVLPYPTYGNIVEPPLKEVPIASLLKTYTKYLKANPKDEHAHYVFARVCSMAFAQDPLKVRVVLKGFDGVRLPYPHLGYYDDHPRREIDTNKKFTPQRLQYLRLAVKHYRESILLNKDGDTLYAWLGYAWTLEQGIAYADKLPAPFHPQNAKLSREYWIAEALKGYRVIFRTKVQEKASSSLYLEAGESIIRLIEKYRKSITPSDQVEIASIQKSLKEIRNRPQAISPIILPLSSQTSFRHLTSNSKRVSFDLAGDGIRRQWSWVSSDTGILVWNPRGKNHITSGYQLFGWVTWCIRWRNGYEPLAALDTDGNGWLEGKELEGIGIWQDKNGNGVSDKGEVKPLRYWGIVRIAVRGHSKVGGVLSNLKGIVKSDGTILPTYDWIANAK